MARKLCYLGLGILAASVWLAIAESVDWIEPGVHGSWVPIGIRIGVACLAGGALLGVLGSVGQRLRHGHCVRCGAPIERGQTYCRDHLQATLNEFRDQTRPDLLKRPGPHV